MLTSSRELVQKIRNQTKKNDREHDSFTTTTAPPPTLHPSTTSATAAAQDVPAKADHPGGEGRPHAAAQGLLPERLRQRCLA